MKKLSIDVWSDIACPWCYVGKRRLEAALQRFPHRDAVEVTWRSFELDPTAPAVRDDGVPFAARLAKKYGRSEREAQGMIDRTKDVAAGDGLDLRFDRAKAGNTFDGHRLLHLAAELGLQGAMKERLFRAYMTEGEAIGDRAVLARLAGEVGVPEADATAMLESDRYTREVREEEGAAREMGINGVPFYVVAEKYGLSGAQPADVLLQALNKAWEALPEEGTAEGEVCGPTGCA
jgi:predicted DsbA family dithiol-disulfide isomerase